jgi:hypothetical protein
LEASSTDNPDQAAARAALLKAMQEADKTNSTVVNVAPVAQPAPASNSNADQAAAMAALTKAMQDADKTNSVVVMTTASAPVDSTPMASTKPVAVTPAPKPSPAPVSVPAVAVAAPSKAVTTLGFKPIVAPALPISTDQQAQLDALNAKYMANEISPAEYFKQREAILNP